MVRENPYVPSEFGRNQKGMQAGEALSGVAATEARAEWLVARDRAVVQAERLLEIGVHKQTTNRLLEPFMWHTALITATDWDNWIHLRDNEHAHPDIQTLARLMGSALAASVPCELEQNEWHLPYIDASEYDLDLRLLCKLSVARCARLSYLTQDGAQDQYADLELHDKLLGNGHMSPFEHVARPMTDDEMHGFYQNTLLMSDGHVDTTQHDPGDVSVGSTWISDGSPTEVVSIKSGAYCGNLNGWVQLRKTISNEWDILGPKTK